MPPVRTMRNILMELRKVCQHPYLSAPELENEEAAAEEQQKLLVEGSGKLMFLKLLLPKLKERGHRVLLFSQFKIALDRIEDFLYGEGYKFLRLDGDVQQAARQKSMDAFNAPDSDHFIFLLTTRAGGVGINLATADTVIIYDPDFNPHMDLQAIARSHRYGQTKKVLVFKLMTKDSVEEQIILKGKQKMVLDHLVVQQMGKENEEGDIDNMLLHGAKALYEADAEGHGPHDINYNSKMVDELIDKVEEEADVEAKAIEERDEAVANGEVDMTFKKPAESMSFGFAKIWEAGRNELQQVEEDEERGDDAAWQQVMDRERERERLGPQLVLEDLPREKRHRNKLIKYKLDGMLSDESPSNKKRKGKGKAVPASSSDTEYAVAAAASDEDDDEQSFGSVPEALNSLFDGTGVAAVGGLAAGRKRLSRKERKALETAYRADAAAVARASSLVQDGRPVPGPSSGVEFGHLGMINGTKAAAHGTSHPANTASSHPGREGETLEQRAERKAKRRAEKAARRVTQIEQAAKAIQARAALAQQSPAIQGQEPLTSIGHFQPPDGPWSSTAASLQLEQPLPHVIHRLSSSHLAPISTVPRQRNRSPLTHEVRLDDGRAVLHWLYQHLRERASNERRAALLQQWAIIAMTDAPAGKRKDHYQILAQIADNHLLSMRQDRYFSKPEQVAAVVYVIDSMAAVVLDVPDPGHMERAPAFPEACRQKLGNVNGIHRSTRNGTAAPTEYLAAPAAGASTHHITTRDPPQGGASSSTPRLAKHLTPISAPRAAAPNGGDLLSSLMDAADWQACNFCQEQHPGRVCPIIPSVADLEMFKAVILNSDEPELDKMRGLEELDNMLRAHAAVAGPAATSFKTAPPPPTNRSTLPQPVLARPVANPGLNGQADVAGLSGQVEQPGRDAPPIHDRRSASISRGTPLRNTKATAIVVDDDSDGETAKRGEPANGHTGHGSSPGKPRSRISLGCRICGSSGSHSAVHCPVVRAGSASITGAMRRFDVKDPMYAILRELYYQATENDATRQCPFCGMHCGRNVRECAETTGGRKGLKDRIRILEKRRSDGDGSEALRLVIEPLYDAYRAWPKPPKDV